MSDDISQHFTHDFECSRNLQHKLDEDGSHLSAMDLKGELGDRPVSGLLNGNSPENGNGSSSGGSRRSSRSNAAKFGSHAFTPKVGNVQISF